MQQLAATNVNLKLQKNRELVSEYLKSEIMHQFMAAKCKHDTKQRARTQKCIRNASACKIELK